MRKIYVVGHSLHYINWMQGEACSKLEEADLVVFTGGEDVSPLIYNRKAHPTTSNNYERDQYEVRVFKTAYELGKPMLGICRGAQFLCACSGGILVQNQENPKLFHQMKTYDGLDLIVTSTHHQAQFPWLMQPQEYNVLGWSKGVSRFHQGEHPHSEMVLGFVVDDSEVEICHYPVFRALGIQSHPEMMYVNQSAEAARASTRWMQSLLDKFLKNELPCPKSNTK